jgi:CPA1 family monovalent cation:H+ antiporter
MPFAAYLAAEHFHCSGILAAVAAGLTMGFVEASGDLAATTRIRRNSVWDTIQFTANGIIFILLGEQLPMILSGAAETVSTTGHHEPWWLIVYVIAINLGLAALRFLWVWLSFRLTLFRAGSETQTPNWRIVAAMSFAGVRGAITLAGIMTLPLAMSDGTAFLPATLRYSSLWALSLSPLSSRALACQCCYAARRCRPSRPMRRKSTPPASRRRKRRSPRRAAAHGASATDPDAYISVAARIMDAYRQRISARGNPKNARRCGISSRSMRSCVLPRSRPNAAKYTGGQGMASSGARRRANWFGRSTSSKLATRFRLEADPSTGSSAARATSSQA